MPLYSVFFTFCTTKQFVQFALCTALHPELFITFQPCILIKEFFLSELVCQKMGEKNDEKNEFLSFCCFFVWEERCSTNLELAAGLSEKTDSFLDMCFIHVFVFNIITYFLRCIYIYIYLYTYICVYNERRWKKVY